MVRTERLELSHLAALEPKSSVSTNSTTSALRKAAHYIATRPALPVLLVLLVLCHRFDLFLQTLQCLVGLQAVGINRFNSLFHAHQAIVETT